MAPTTHELARDTWRQYFDELSGRVGAARTTLEVAARDLGDQIVAEGLPLRGITYDDKDDVLVIALEPGSGGRGDFEHLVERPQRIYVDDGDDGETTIDVEDTEGRKTLVHLDAPDHDAKGTT